jgi:hypothetical protein
LDGDYCKSTTFAAFGTTIAVTTIVNIGRSIDYQTTNGESGDTTCF